MFSTSSLGPALQDIYHIFAGFLPKFFGGAESFASKAFTVIEIICILLSLFFFIVIIYCVEGLKLIRKREDELHTAKVEEAFNEAKTGDTAMAHRWENALKHVESPNPNDWKQAIIDADIILDDLLTKMGYRGESIGEKLKRVASGDMKSLDSAWEAHKIRNQIAHEGSAFNLDQHTARQTIHNYRKVFEEFYYI